MELKDTLITRTWLRRHHACYYQTPEGTAKADAVIPSEGITLEVLLQDERIPSDDKVWVCTRPGLLPDSMHWAVAASALEQQLAVANVTDPRSLAVVVLLRRLAAGEDVPQAERDAAYAAARFAYWDAAAWSAALDTSRASAWYATLAAARDAAWSVWAAHGDASYALADFKRAMGVL